MADTTPIDPQLLDILRSPVAVQDKSKGSDPGRLAIRN